MKEAEAEYQVVPRLTRAMKAGRLYGTGLLVMVTREADLSEPLDLESVRPGDLIHLLPLDRYDATRFSWDENPYSPTYGSQHSNGGCSRNRSGSSTWCWPVRRRAVFLTPAEWLDLDRSMVGTPSRAMIAIAFLAGLRQGEIRHLRTGVDVLLEGPEPLIRVQSRKDAYSWRPKTRRGERDVPITESLVTVIENHIRRGYARERYLIVSPHRGDQPVTGGTSARWTREAFELAGIKYGREGDGLTLHSGRHTYASWLAQDGVPLNVIATLLGDTTKVVEETYAHLIPDTYRAAVQAIEKRLQG